MKDIFLSNIHVDKFDDLRDFDIPLSVAERKHLVITGVNGSGKTRLLEALRDSLLPVKEKTLCRKGNLDSEDPLDGWDPEVGNKLSLSYSCDSVNQTDVPVFYFPDCREPELLEASKDGTGFIGYMLSISKSNPELYRQCLSGLQGFLRGLHKEPGLELKVDAEMGGFTICLPNKEPFALHEISLGLASLTSIYMELAMRPVLANGSFDLEFPAIALIDEPELHLHVSLQRLVLPILVQAFPNVQFIVTTNSPFIITALENAVVFDIRKKTFLEYAMFYTYSTIADAYYCTKQRYQALQEMLARFKELALKKNISQKAWDELRELRVKLMDLTPIDNELYLEYKEIKAQQVAMWMS
jgi:hypothetical protein